MKMLATSTLIAFLESPYCKRSANQGIPINAQLVLHACCALFRMSLSLVVWVLSLKLVAIEGSIGDRSVDFRRCVSRCDGERCGSGSVLADPWLRALGWSCIENCRYDCMRSVTDDDVKFSRPIRQFYGKVCRMEERKQVLGAWLSSSHSVAMLSAVFQTILVTTSVVTKGCSSYTERMLYYALNHLRGGVAVTYMLFLSSPAVALC